MRWGIDVDGVVAGFIEAYVREVNSRWPGKLPVGYQPVNWDWSPEMTEADNDIIWSIIKHKHNWWLSVPADFENIRAVAEHRMRHPQDELFFVTARVSTKGMPVMHQTQTWLSQCGVNGLGVAVIVDHSGDKAAIFNALECDANVDDKLEAVIEHHAHTRNAFLLSRPWNQSGRPSSINAVGSLKDFFRRLRDERV